MTGTLERALQESKQCILDLDLMEKTGTEFLITVILAFGTGLYLLLSII